MVGLDDLVGLRDALVRARAKGVASVSYDGQRVDYKSDADMAAALADLERRIAALQPGAARRPIFTSYSKGI